MKIRIRNKLLITICSLILLSLAGQILFNQFLSKSFYTDQQKSIIADAFEQIKAGYGDNLDNINGIAENLQDVYGIKTVLFNKSDIIYSSGYSFIMKGQRLGINMIFHNADFTANPTVNFVEGKGVIGDNNRLQLAGKFYHDGEEIRVLLTLQIAAIDNSISVFTESNTYISVFVLIIGILMAVIVSKTISAPIINIEAVSKKIAKLDFSYVADEKESTVELASLAHSVNQMSRQLDRNMLELTAANEQLQKDVEYRKQIESYRREFIASISHEMKTPLALLQIYTENLKNNIDGIDRDYYCDTILEETEKLNKMVSDMLEISSIDSGFIKLHFGDIDLSKFKPGNFASKEFDGAKGNMPNFSGKFMPGKDINNIMEKLKSLTEEEKAALKDKVQSFTSGNEFANKAKMFKKFGRSMIGSTRPTFGENNQ